MVWVIGVVKEVGAQEGEGEGEGEEVGGVHPWWEVPVLVQTIQTWTQSQSG